jgi:flavin reductase (DIM6/NTAB) family NADH-FMN oxidoreductase RutF
MLSAPDNILYICRMLSVLPSELTIPKLHQYLLGSIGPRPICFASTVDRDGRPNLAPFSFFNVFSANPPILIFSPARSGRTGETKHTHDNVKEVPEVVINVVTYEMVHQVSLASSPFPKGVDEFIKTGFTPIASDLVKPARVKESPVQLECEVQQVIELGSDGGAGNLVVCKVLKLHIDETKLNEHGAIDQTKIDLVARMGGDWYCRANGNALFELVKPLTICGIGVDALPEHIRLSHQLSGNELGMLGNVEIMPTEEDSSAAKALYVTTDTVLRARQLLAEGKNKEALALLW